MRTHRVLWPIIVLFSAVATLRAIPRVLVIRPGDANETAVAWRVAIESKKSPVALILSRQDVSTLDRKMVASANGLRSGAYILSDVENEKPELIMIASGSEVGLIVEAKKELEKQNISVRLVSMPSWELFESQTPEYRDKVLPKSVRAKLVVEAGRSQGWCKYAGNDGEILGIDKFGASAPGEIVMEKYGFTVDAVCKHALALLKKSRS